MFKRGNVLIEEQASIFLFQLRICYVDCFYPCFTHVVLVLDQKVLTENSKVTLQKMAKRWRDKDLLKDYETKRNDVLMLRKKHNL